jgi:hypothetical protein
MSTVILEIEAEKLENLSGRVEVRNASGKLLGTFSPAVEEVDELGEPKLTEEELRETLDRMRQGEFYTTAQVLAHLESLGTD